MPRAFLVELQRKKDAVKYDAHADGPRTLSKTGDANLDCAFVKNILSTTELDFEKSTNRIRLITRPG